MIQTHRLVGIALFLWGFYLVCSFLTRISGSPAIPMGTAQSPISELFIYLPLVVGIMSMAFGIYLMVRRKPIIPEEALHQPKVSIQKTKS